MISRKRTSSLHSLNFWLELAFPTRLSTNQVWPVSKSSRVNVSFGFLERAMGIELHPKFLSLTETRCYQPLRESIVAKELPKTKRGKVGVTTLSTHPRGPSVPSRASDRGPRRRLMRQRIGLKGASPAVCSSNSGPRFVATTLSSSRTLPLGPSRRHIQIHQFR